MRVTLASIVGAAIIIVALRWIIKGWDEATAYAALLVGWASIALLVYLFTNAKSSENGSGTRR